MTPAPAAPGGIGERLFDLGQAVILAATLGGGGMLLRAIRASRRRRARLKRFDDVASDSLRTLDVVRNYLYRRALEDGEAEATVLRLKVDEIREQLWTATGHESKRRPLTERDVLRLIKQSQPDARAPQDMFPPEDTDR